MDVKVCLTKPLQIALAKFIHAEKEKKQVGTGTPPTGPYRDILTISMAYGTRRLNAAFTRVLQ